MGIRSGYDLDTKIVAWDTKRGMWSKKRVSPVYPDK